MRKGVMVLVGIAVLLTIFTLVMSNYYPNSLTGRILFGSVSLYISSDGPTIIIHNPQNVTYNFGIGSNYTLDLNVSTPSNNISAWWYTLEDIFHGVVVNQSVIFTPNISFNAVRRTNRLIVYANDSIGQTGSKSVVFFVAVPNSAPLLGNISDSLDVCEASSLLYDFNATDVDEENLFLSVSPASPFFVFPNTFSGVVTAYSQLFSGILTKANVGVHNRTISVSDGEYSDSKNMTITVIEINNPPVATEIGVQTIYTRGEGTNFYHRFIVGDIEDGDSVNGNLTFNISFNGGPALFNITNNSGIMNFTANESYIGVHNITLCATDQGLAAISSNSSLCGETGESKYACINFSLTVTNENRAPTILTYSPYEIYFNATGETTIYFNITSYDPDGTIPDAYWYLQGSQVKYQQGSYYSNYSVTFPCGEYGLKTVKARVTDGLENDSVSWNISLTGTVCPGLVEPSSGGGGGGGGGPFCIPQWGCNDWTICQNTKVSLDIGVIGQSDYRDILESCATFNLDESNCGYQTRSCFDNKFCNSSLSKPSFLQSCSYSSNPSCQDNMKNCHDGSCELLIDCGGPCQQCASCSDKVQNQGELGIDCGGPCPFICPSQTPFISISFWRTIIIWLFWLLLIILLIILIRRIWRLIEVHRELQKERKIQSILSK